jgi:hypothetical protein
MMLPPMRFFTQRHIQRRFWGPRPPLLVLAVSGDDLPGRRFSHPFADCPRFPRRQQQRGLGG